MWRHLTLEDTELLARSVEVVTQANPAAPRTTVASLRAGIAHGLIDFYYYAAPQFEMTLEFIFHARRKRHVVCANVIGTVDPAAAMDLVVEQGFQFAEERGVDSLYALRPKGLSDTPVAAFYDAVKQEASLRVTTVAETSDAEIWEIRSASAPETVAP